MLVVEVFVSWKKLSKMGTNHANEENCALDRVLCHIHFYAMKEKPLQVSEKKKIKH